MHEGTFCLCGQFVDNSVDKCIKWALFGGYILYITIYTI